MLRCLIDWMPKQAQIWCDAHRRLLIYAFLFVILWLAVYGLSWGLINVEGLANYILHFEAANALSPEALTGILSPGYLHAALASLLAVVGVAPGLFFDKKLPDLPGWLWPAPPAFLIPLRESDDPTFYNSRKAMLAGRDQELKRLIEFMSNRTPTFAWWWIRGDGGIGKSRLAFEALLTLKKHDGGFAVSDLSDVADSWKSWQPRRPTVIVIDDALSKEDLVRPLLKKLRERAEEGALAHPVRILLADRGHPFRSAASERDLPGGGHHHEPLVLGELSGQDITAIVRQLHPETSHAEEIAKKAKGRPLLAILLAQADKDKETIDEALHRYLDRLHDKLEEYGFPASCRPLLALATLTGGLPWAEAQRLMPEIGDFKSRKPSLRAYAQDVPDDILPPLKPDFFGDFLTLTYFQDRQGEFDGAAYLQKAWELAPHQVAFALLRMKEDFS